MIKTKKQDWKDLIRETKAYWQDSDIRHIDRANKVSRKIAKQCGVDWLCISHLAECIFSSPGFAPEQPETVLFEILKILGIEVE